jgi:hypothetical protein
MKVFRGATTSALFVAAGLLVSACDAGSGADATPQATATPLPGVTDTSIAIGVVTLDTSKQQSQDLRFKPPTFFGLSQDEVDAFLPPTATLAGRTLTVTALEFAPEFGTLVTNAPVQPTCSAQSRSAVVITDVPSTALVDCLLANGSIVIDASYQAWDTTALNQRAPRLWATATAAADIAEKVMLTQAEQRGALPAGEATVILGTDPLLRRVAESVTIPALSSAGLAVLSVEEIEEAEGGFGRGPAVERILERGPEVIRAMTILDYLAINNFTTPTAEAPTAPTLLVTSNNAISVGTFNATGLAATRGLGWSPFRDEPTTPSAGPRTAPSSPDAGAACTSTYPDVDFENPKQFAQSFLYRWCDAVNLLRLGLRPAQAPTLDSFKESVWTNGSTWNPAAVLAQGWTPQSFAGANRARWLTGASGEGCPPATDACVVADPTLIPLS